MNKCEFCHGEIDSNVKKCRHCGEWLKKWKYTPTKQLISIVIAMAFYFAFTHVVSDYFLKDRMDLFPKKIFYSTSSNELSLDFSEQRSKNHLYILGTITNNSQHQYESIIIGTTYYDEMDQMLDYAQEYIGTLEAGKMKKFKSNFTCCDSKEGHVQSYAKYKRFEVQVEDGYYEVPKNRK